MKLDEFLGQSTLVTLIKKKLKQNKIGHAYLFSGPAGQGKKTLATLFAKGILCLKRKKSKEESFCDSCSSCKKIDKHIHPDLYIIGPQGKSIKIDQIRELKKRLLFGPTESEKKVFIFKDVQNMSREAANSMLNFLEEPHEHVVSILLTSNLSLILPTILSRCETYKFSSIPPGEMYDYFRKNINYNEKEIKKAVALSQGQLEKAKNYLHGEIDREKEEQVENLMYVLLNNGQATYLFDWAQYLAGMEAEDLETFFEFLVLYLREIYIYKLSGQIELLVGFDNITSISKDINFEKVERIMDILKKTREYLNFNVNKLLAFEGMLLEIKEEIRNE